MVPDDFTEHEQPLDYVAPFHKAENSRYTAYYWVISASITLIVTMLDWVLFGSLRTSASLALGAFTLTVLVAMLIAGSAWLFGARYSLQQFSATVFTLCLVGFIGWTFRALAELALF